MIIWAGAVIPKTKKSSVSDEPKANGWTDGQTDRQTDKALHSCPPVRDCGGWGEERIRPCFVLFFGRGIDDFGTFLPWLDHVAAPAQFPDFNIGPVSSPDTVPAHSYTTMTEHMFILCLVILTDLNENLNKKKGKMY